MRGQWVPARNGELPDGAVQGGYDNKVPLFIARVSAEGNVIPGKLHPEHGCCYYGLNGKEHSSKEYEVLCHSDGIWMKVTDDEDDEFPEEAIPAGKLKNENVYIGRAYHKDTLTPGKIVISHECCYIPYGGLDICYKKCEVFFEFDGPRPTQSSDSFEEMENFFAQYD